MTDTRPAETRRPRPTDLDPRPDLADDHRAWVAVLAIAWEENRMLWGDLHGFRCAGARLTVIETDSGRTLKLLYDEVVELGWRRETFREGWLVPWRDELRSLFVRAVELMEQTTAEQGRRIR